MWEEIIVISGFIGNPTGVLAADKKPMHSYFMFKEFHSTTLMHYGTYYHSIPNDGYLSTSPINESLL